MGWDLRDKQFYKKLIKQLTGKITAEDGELIPEVAIIGSGEVWCYHITDKRMVPVVRGTKAYLVDEVEDERGRIVIYTSTGDLVAIDKEEILDTGFD